MKVMKLTFDDLEITAVLKYYRPMPGDMEIDCELTARAFVDGACPVEEELRGLEAFRKALIKLTEEGLSRPPNSGPSQAPFVGLTLTAGEEGREKPDLDFYVSLGREQLGDLDVWVLRWTNEEGVYVSPIFVDVGRALKILKYLLDKKTGQWASLVAFQTNHVDS